MVKEQDAAQMQPKKSICIAGPEHENHICLTTEYD